MFARLNVVGGSKTKRIKLHLPTIIGRGGESTVKLPASTVSRQHCEIYEYEGQLAVRDLGSSNGTVVNGHRIDGPTFVNSEDVICVGPLVFQLELLGKSKLVAASEAPPTENEQPQNDSVESESPVEETAAEEVEVPSFDELPTETTPPVAAEVATDEIPYAEVAADDDGSVLKYAEPKNDGERSFVGIVGEETPAKEDSAPAFEDQAETPDTVGSDDSALNDFFKNLD